MPAWRTRNVLGFVLLGLINNLTFVVNNAAAGDILSGQIGVIYIINCVPELLVKATAPFWWHLLSYRVKIIIAGVSFAISMTVVSGGLGTPTWLKLLGVAISDAGGGLGEASVLALSQFYDDDSATMLTAWSSGTGFAGVVGYLLSIFVLPHITTVPGKLAVCASIPAAYWAVYFLLLPPPWVDKARGAATRDPELDAGAESPLSASPLPGSTPEGARPTDAGGGGADGEAAAGSARVGGEVRRALTERLVAPSPSEGDCKPLRPRVDSSAGLSSAAKLRLQLRLLRYIGPLVLVYWAEYAAQSGAWSAFALPASALHDKAARDRGYKLLNLFYQVGVLLSRSAGKLFSLSTRTLWAHAWLQVVLLVLFVADAATQAWLGYWLVAPALAVGLLGGTNYVQTVVAIDRELPPEHRELALSTASVGSPVGILLADVTGLLIQGCVFNSLHVEPRGVCPVDFPPLPAAGNSSRAP